MKINSGFLFYPTIGLFGIAAFVLIIWTTPYGAGVSADSTLYIRTAENILSGSGYSIMGSPVTHYPPLYPLVLAAVGLLEENLVQAARLLNAVLFSVNIGFVALALYLTVGRSFLAITSAMLFFLTSSPFIVMHSHAWSEPLFITFSLACVIFLSLYCRQPRFLLLIVSAIFLGFALLTRYIGAAFLPPALVITFIAGGGHQIGRKIRSMLIYTVLASAPLGVLLLRNMITAGSAVNRDFVIHPVPVSSFVADFIATIYHFFAPTALISEARSLIFWLFTALFITLTILLFIRHRGNRNWRSLEIIMPLACLLFISCYVVFLFLSITFIDAATTVDTRLLSPIIAISIPGIFSGLWSFTQTFKKPLILWGFVLLLLLSISMKTLVAVETVTSMRKDGRGYTSRVWRNSESIAFIKMVKDDVKLYSNGVEVIRFLTKRESLLIPQKQSSFTLKVNQHYDKEIEIMCSSIMDKKALLVYFDRIGKWYLPTRSEIEAACLLPIQQQFSDGTLYGQATR